MGKRQAIKKSIGEIVDYWSQHEDECGLSVDWAEALVANLSISFLNTVISV